MSAPIKPSIVSLRQALVLADEHWRAAISAQAQRDALVLWLKAVDVHLCHAPISEFEGWNADNADWIERIDSLPSDGSPLDPEALRAALPASPVPRRDEMSNLPDNEMTAHSGSVTPGPAAPVGLDLDRIREWASTLSLGGQGTLTVEYITALLDLVSRQQDALRKLATIGLAIRSAGPWTKRDAWPQFFDAVDEADALAGQPMTQPFGDRP